MHKFGIIAIKKVKKAKKGINLICFFYFMDYIKEYHL